MGIDYSDILNGIAVVLLMAYGATVTFALMAVYTKNKMLQNKLKLVKLAKRAFNNTF